MKGPVRIVETGGVTAAELWRLCRERDCAVVPNLIPRNDAGRGLLAARLLCMGYALARAGAVDGEERLLCVAPEGKVGVAEEFCGLGERFDPHRFSFAVSGPITLLEGLRRVVVGSGDYDWSDISPADFGAMLQGVLDAGEPGAPGGRPFFIWDYEYDPDSISRPFSYEFRRLPYSFAGEREGELFLYGLDFIETGLRRLEDYGEEEQAAIRAAAKAQPRFKSDWEYPGPLPG